MDIFILAVISAIGVHLLKSKYQRKRIALLGSHLGKFQIEKLMETLTEGYLRAVGETNPERRAQIWQLLTSTETTLCEQLNGFNAELSSAEEPETRVSKLALTLPYADRLFPDRTFDLRRAMAIHVQGITRAVENNTQRTPKAKAFTVSAELFLLQHTCHWFCKSKTVASARLLGRHKTSYEQLVESVAPETRQAYGALIGL